MIGRTQEPASATAVFKNPTAVLPRWHRTQTELVTRSPLFIVVTSLRLYGVQLEIHGTLSLHTRQKWQKHLPSFVVVVNHAKVTL